MPPKRRSVKGKSKEEEPMEIIIPDQEMEAEAEVAAAVDQLLCSPEKDPIEESATPQPMSAASLSVARSRLSTLLSKIHREEVEMEAARSRSPTADPLGTEDVDGRESPTVAKSKNDSLLGGPSKKRRRREAPEVGGPHHSYVMKLFDRSVDLAQFNEKTALYPVCRAWMANKPRHVPKPNLSDSDEEYDYLDFGNDELGKAVRKMPPPELKSEAHDRVPHKLPQKAKGDLNIKQEGDETLLEAHKLHWRKVKQDWVNAAFSNETRYSNSIKMIEDIYKRAQEMYS